MGAGISVLGKAGRERLSALEAGCVFLQIELYIWWLRGELPLWWMGILACVLASHVWHGETPRELGFGWRELKAAAPVVTPWLVNLVWGVWALGILFDTVRPARVSNVIGDIFTYMLWGTVQQYLLNGYFARRMQRAGFGHHAVATLSAAVFAAAHFPNWFLVAVTLAGGYVSVRVFLRYGSVVALGMAHGIVGCALRFTLPDSITGHLIVGPRYWTL